MYERSAIVLERAFNGLLGFDQKINLKVVYKNYRDIIEEIEVYQELLKEDDIILHEFDTIASDIRKIQKEHKRIYEANTKLEEYRDQLLSNIDEDYAGIEKKLLKIEENLNKNNKREEELRESYIQALKRFSEKQVERKKHSRKRREEEAKHLQIIQKSQVMMKQMDDEIIGQLRKTIETEFGDYKDGIVEIMIGNGKDERVGFDTNVIENSVKVRIDIAKREAECYISIYEKFNQLLKQLESDDVVEIHSYKTLLRDVDAKFEFLKAEKSYIFSFLDNERMTSLNGVKVHKQLMMDSCEKLELDIEQFEKLYELLLREIMGKATKKSYLELYNKEYLKNIEDREKTFEKQVNNMQMRTGTIINTNSWRIEEVKNMYDVFQREVSEKFDRDFSEFKLEEVEDQLDIEDDIFKTKSHNTKKEEFYDEDIFDEDEEDYEEDDDDDYFEQDYDENEDIEENDDDDYEDEDESDEEDYDEDEDEYDEEEDDDDDNEEEDDDDDDGFDDNDDILNKHVDEQKDKGIFNKFFGDKKNKK